MKDVLLQVVGNDSTIALQHDIDAVSAAGGGRVAVPKGIHRIRPVELKNGVELHLEEGAVLLGSGDWRDYPDRPLRHCDAAACPRGRSSALIWADEARDIAITGPGRIDANGPAFLREATREEAAWGYTLVRKGGFDESPPRVVLFAGCRNVRVTEIEMTGLPGGWAFWVHDCDDVLFDGVRIKADLHCANNDGIHVNCCRDVAVRRCDITTGDDAVIVRANSRSLRENRPCERVMVEDCTLRSWSCGIRIGWANDGIIRDCRFSRIAMRDTTYGIAMELPNRKQIPSDYGREATAIHDLVFEDIEMDGIYAHPLFCSISSDPSTLCTGVGDISFRNIRALSLEPPFVKGRDGTPFRRFSFKNCSFALADDERLPHSDSHGAASKGRHPGGTFEFAEGFTFDTVPANLDADVLRDRLRDNGAFI